MRPLSVCQFLLLLLAYAPAAHAYEAKVGNRAAEIAGWDIVGQRTVRLSDYLGQWVLVDFWGTWCGPCREELPKMLADTAPYRRSGKLALIGVLCDYPEALPEARKMIREHRIDFPQLYDGLNTESIPAVEWAVDSYPRTFLINPQGVIVSTSWRKEVIDYWMNSGRPPFSLESNCDVNTDGSITVRVHASNPWHEPVEIRVHRQWQVWDAEYLAGTGKRKYDIDVDYAKGELEFDEFGEGHWEYTIPADPTKNWMGYDLSMRLNIPEIAPGVRLAVSDSKYSMAMIRGLIWTKEVGFKNDPAGPVMTIDQLKELMNP